MNAITTAPARQSAQVQQVLVPRTFDQLVTFAEMAATSGMVPKAYDNKPGAIMVAVQMGSELGLSPMQSINSIAVINGRPGVWGDGLIGICRASPLCEDIIETLEGEGDQRVARCVAKRRGATPTSASFSVLDAKKAGLWQTEERVKRKGRDGSSYEATNDSPWFRYPDRMLQNRARGFALRDAFPDLLRGLKTVEELRDTPPDNYRGTTLDAVAEPARSHPINPEPLRRAAASGAFSDEPMGAAPKPETIPDQPRRTYRQLIDETAGMLKACDTVEAVLAVGQLPQVNIALTKGSPTVQVELKALLADAYERVQALSDDAAEAEEVFPGDIPLEAEAPAPA